MAMRLLAYSATVGAAVASIVFYFFSRATDPEISPDVPQAVLGTRDTEAGTAAVPAPAPSEQPGSGSSASTGPALADTMTDSPEAQFSLATEKMLSGWFGYERYENFLRNEPRDPTWAPQMEANIFNNLAYFTLPYYGVYAHCRTTICRIEVAYEKSREDVDIENRETAFSRQFRDKVVNPLTRAGGRFDSSAAAVVGRQSRDPKETVVYVVYMKKETLLPPPPELPAHVQQAVARAMEEERAKQAQAAAAELPEQ